MIFFACNLTLTHLCTRDDSLGFEDCRLATHLLNYVEPKMRPRTVASRLLFFLPLLSLSLGRAAVLRKPRH